MKWATRAPQVGAFADALRWWGAADWPRNRGRPTNCLRVSHGLRGPNDQVSNLLGVSPPRHGSYQPKFVPRRCLTRALMCPSVKFGARPKTDKTKQVRRPVGYGTSCDPLSTPPDGPDSCCFLICFRLQYPTYVVTKKLGTRNFLRCIRR